MIMAGRGRRLTDTKQESTKSVGLSPPAESSTNSANKLSFAEVVNEINLTGANASVLPKIHACVNEVFITKDAMRNTLSDLHSKALTDPLFGEKFVLALEQISSFEVDGVLLRNELLSFIQNDFKSKETLFQSDRNRFLNAVLLLGGVFNRIKICGEPIEILGLALLDYFDLLIKGDEEEFKILIKQIYINGEKLRKINRFELIENDLRKIIVNENLSSKCKCWILLAIDVLSHGCKPLKGIVRNFYVANLGEEYKKFEMLVPSERTNQSVSPKCANSGDVTVEKKKSTPESSPGKRESYQRDLSENISNLNLRGDKGNKERIQSPPGGKSKKKDFGKSSGNARKSGHDDRFEREENFYGVQKPRQPKMENQRANFSEP